MLWRLLGCPREGPWARMLYSLFVIARGTYDRLPSVGGVTASLSVDFVGFARAGSWIEARGEVVKEGADLVFVRGTIMAAGKVVASFRGIVKKLKRSNV